MSDVLSVVLVAAGVLLAALLGSLLLQSTGSVGTEAPAFEQGEYRIVQCKESSAGTLQLGAFLSREKRQQCKVVVGTKATRASVQETVQTILQDKTKSDPDLDVIILFLYSTEDRTSNAWDVASAVWSPDGTWNVTSAEIARGNDRTGYVLNIDVREDLESYLTAIGTSARINGLDENTRRAIFKAITVCEDAAYWEASKRYDSYCGRCREFITIDQALSWAYIDTYEADCKGTVMRRHRISSDALDAISLEGMEKNWPVSTPIPPPACCE